MKNLDLKIKGELLGGSELTEAGREKGEGDGE
jgi:hypothetical protein